MRLPQIPRKMQAWRKIEKDQNLRRVEGVSEKYEDDVPCVADGIREVHHEDDVGPLFSDGDQTFENRGVDGYIGDIDAETDQYHEGEFAQSGM